MRRLLWLVFCAAVVMAQAHAAEATVTASPAVLYQQGQAFLLSYRGQSSPLYHAKAIFSRLMEQYPGSPFGYLGMSQVLRMEAYRSEGHYDIARLREALPLAKQALELGPLLKGSHENYSHYVDVFERNYDEQERVREFLSLRPDSPQTYFRVADFIRDQGDYAAAAEYYQTALDLKPTNYLRLRILQRLALLYLEQLHQPGEAIRLYLEALTLEPESPVLYEYLGEAYLQSQDYAKAAEVLKTSLNLLPSSTAEYRLMLAAAYQARQDGRLEEALQFFSRAVRERPQDGALHFVLGDIYFQRADFARAHDHFREVISLTPEDSNAYFFAGRSADSMGRDDLANDYYRSYLQLNSDGDKAAWVRQHFSMSASSIGR